MKRYVAFLRGMNLGRRRIKNGELCACFADMGFSSVAAFLASGNVIFDAALDDPASLSARIESGLRQALHYDVPTFLRSAERGQGHHTVSTVYGCPAQALQGQTTGSAAL